MTTPVSDLQVVAGQIHRHAVILYFDWLPLLAASP